MMNLDNVPKICKEQTDPDGQSVLFLRECGIRDKLHIVFLYPIWYSDI